MAYFSYARGLPLTIRSTLAPLFGNCLNGLMGHAFDITAIIATLLGVAVTVGYGISQLIAGFYGITGWDWMMTAAPQPGPTKNILIFALLVVMVLSTISAVTGVGRGIKYLSNLNLGLSCLLLLVFMIFGLSLSSERTKVEFFPNNQPNQIIVYIEYPQGTAIEKTNAITKEIEKRVYKQLVLNGLICSFLSLHFP